MLEHAVGPSERHVCDCKFPCPHTARCDEGRDAGISLASMSGVEVEEDMAIRSFHSMTMKSPWQVGKLVIDAESLSGPSVLIEPPVFDQSHWRQVAKVMSAFN